LSDFDEQMDDALQTAGFETMKVRVRDLGDDTIVNMIRMRPDTVILAAIKRPSGSGAAAPRAAGPRGGVSGGTRRRMCPRTRRNSLRKARRYSKFRR